MEISKCVLVAIEIHKHLWFFGFVLSNKKIFLECGNSYLTQIISIVSCPFLNSRNLTCLHKINLWIFTRPFIYFFLKRTFFPIILITRRSLVQSTWTWYRPVVDNGHGGSEEWIKMCVWRTTTPPSPIEVGHGTLDSNVLYQVYCFYIANNGWKGSVLRTCINYGFWGINTKLVWHAKHASTLCVSNW